MARYIEIDNLEVAEYITVWDCNCSEYGKQTVMAVDDLQYLPIADVKEVIHGYWMPFGGRLGDSQCSNCKSVFDGDMCSHYCPECGAKMDGKRKEK